MATAKQIAANTRNARLPRGPLSEAAAAALRENALKHGLTARHIVLSYEDRAAYEELRASITMEYQPQSPQEHRLADQIAQNYWRLLRCRRIETGTFENRLGTLKDRLKVPANAPVDNDQGLSICYANHGPEFDTIRRYETSIEKAWYRAIRELRTLQKERREIEAEQAAQDACNPPIADTIAPGPSPLFDSRYNLKLEIGCVSKNTKSANSNGPESEANTHAGESKRPSEGEMNQ